MEELVLAVTTDDAMPIKTKHHEKEQINLNFTLLISCNGYSNELQL